MTVQPFQSTLPREERPASYRRSLCVPVFQSTLPREERLGHDFSVQWQEWAFQSTLPREERQINIQFTLSFSYFNPRSHERSDATSSYSISDGIVISIHAPTRGATYIIVLCNSKNGFQSTLPREERRKRIVWRSIPLDFNPRSHERSD